MHLLAGYGVMGLGIGIYSSKDLDEWNDTMLRYDRQEKAYRLPPLNGQSVKVLDEHWIEADNIGVHH